MKLSIKDLQDSSVYEVAPQGAVLGRERARTDIALPDESVSKRHARVYAEAGAWFLEDLNSSNGTYLDHRRVDRPVRLHLGAVFALAQQRFEVVALDEDAPPEPRSRLGGGLPAASEGFSGVPQPRFPQPSGFFGALGRGLLYFPAELVRLVLNPLGTTRRSAAHLPLPPLEPLERMAFVLPVCVMLAVVRPLSVAAHRWAAPGGDWAAALDMLYPDLAVAFGVGVAVAALVGWLGDGLLRWWLDRLHGHSDDTSRWNYLGLATVAAGLLLLPLLLHPLVPLLEQPLVQVLPFALACFALAVMVLVHYYWFRSFQVVRWFQGLVLVSGVLGLGLSFVQLFLVGISSYEAWAGQSGSQKAPRPPVAPVASAASQPAPKAAPAVPSEVAPAAPAPSTAPSSAGASPFARYERQRQAIEAALDAHPGLVENDEIEALYSTLWEQTYKVRRKYKRRRKEPWRDKVNRRKRDWATYRRTRKTVEALHERIEQAQRAP